MSDLVCLALPLWSIKGLEVRKKGKWGLVAIFSVGGLACVASLARVYLTTELDHVRDETWDFYSFYLWS